MQRKRPWFYPRIRKIWRREWLSTPVSLTEEFHGLQKRADYSPLDGKESGANNTHTHTRTHTHTHTHFFLCYSFLKKLFFKKNFSCVACGILVLRIKPKHPVVEVQCLHHWTTRKFPLYILLLNTFKF